MQKEKILKPEYIEKLEHALEQKGIKFNNMAEFDRYFGIEKTKKPAEYQPEPEPLTDTEIYDLASKCVYGLEYVIFKTEYDKIPDMLRGGIKFTEIQIQEGDEEAKTIKTELESLLTSKEAVSTMRIREIQHFMNERSKPYFLRHMNRIRPKNHKKGCF